METRKKKWSIMLLLGLLVICQSNALWANCVNPDDNGGTVLYPGVNCVYTNVSGPVFIVTGLPAGDTIEINVELRDFLGIVNVAGGGLGGETSVCDASLHMSMQGTGTLGGFARNIVVPIFGLQTEIGPRVPGNAVQSFPNEMISLFGQVFGDPDFCTFRISAGIAQNHPDFGLGQTTLTRQGLPGSDFQVDSFFDMEYQIDFQGCPGSILDGYAGSTVRDVRIATCPGQPQPQKVLKFQQLPMDGPTDPSDNFRYYGHDSVSTAYSRYNFQNPLGPQLIGYQGCFRADDFADYADTPAICVKWWGSYLNNEIHQPVEKFLIAFEKDVPAGVTGPFSHPGTVLSSEIVHQNTSSSATCDTLNPGEYIERIISPGGPPCDEELYEYCAVLQKPFPQEPNTVYWIKIVALIDLPPSIAQNHYDCIDQNGPNPDGVLTPAELCDYLEHQPQNFCDLTRWGWHNRDYRFEDIYASHPPHVIPGEDKIGSFIDPITGNSYDVWHFQDDAVAGEVFVDMINPLNPNDPDCPDVIQPQASFWEQYYLHNSPFCPVGAGIGIDGPPQINQFSLDLAFELWTEELPPPPTPEHELGDAPDQTNNHGALMMAFPGVPADYPTVFGAGAPFGPLHLRPLDGAYLGAGVTRENEADLLPDEDGLTNIDPPADVPDLDLRDDSVHFPLNLRHCERNRFDYDVTVVLPQDYFVNVWFDWNQNGNWRDTLTCSGASGANIVPEWAVQNQWIDGAVLGAGLHTITTPDFIAMNFVSPNLHPETWMRIQISEQPWTPNTGIGVGGDGPAAGYQFGETEDYLARLGCACRGDLSTDGISPGSNGVIDFGDFNYFLAQFGASAGGALDACTPGTPFVICPIPANLLCADLSTDGITPGQNGRIDFGDFNYFLAVFGSYAPTFVGPCLP
jgi:hypothetical protein